MLLFNNNRGYKPTKPNGNPAYIYNFQNSLARLYSNIRTVRNNMASRRPIMLLHLPLPWHRPTPPPAPRPCTAPPPWSAPGWQSGRRLARRCETTFRDHHWRLLPRSWRQRRRGWALSHLLIIDPDWVETFLQLPLGGIGLPTTAFFIQVQEKFQTLAQK